MHTHTRVCVFVCVDTYICVYTPHTYAYICSRPCVTPADTSPSRRLGAEGIVDAANHGEDGRA